MKTIEYRAVYSGWLGSGQTVSDNPSEEVIRVQARSINSGYTKALRIALQPLGNGHVRELHSLQFWQVTS